MPRCRVFFVKLTVTKLVKFPAFWNSQVHNCLIETHQQTLFWASWIHSILSLKSILMLSSNLCIVPLSGLFHWRFVISILYTILMSQCMLQVPPISFSLVYPFYQNQEKSINYEASHYVIFSWALCSQTPSIYVLWGWETKFHTHIILHTKLQFRKFISSSFSTWHALASISIHAYTKKLY
jgi:hypothetical protein